MTHEITDEHINTVFRSIVLRLNHFEDRIKVLEEWKEVIENTLLIHAKEQRVLNDRLTNLEVYLGIWHKLKENKK
jgi:hypothetical protein